MEEAYWYVVHTYSGYENKVKVDLEKAIENRGLQDYILEVNVPMEDVIEVKNGTRRQVQRKMFPGYVLVKLIMNDETWYVVRNTRGVTGFVGPGSKPVPLSDLEMRKLGIQEEGQVINIEIDFEVGDKVSFISGAWKDTVGEISEINQNKQTVTINVAMFGRSTPVELNFLEVEKV
ncbi:MAG: transcription termination/antitermination factor NusG [Lachnospiraceae bacterium]|nr:transcription termination/antitermination factor NusG [Lachnospiraceae bacterium]